MMMFFDSTNAQMARLINLAMLKGCKDRSKGNKEFTIRMKNSKSLVPLIEKERGEENIQIWMDYSYFITYERAMPT